MSETDAKRTPKGSISIEYKCPMPDCGLVQQATWGGIDFPESLEGISIGDTLEGPFSCPDCEDNGVAHSDMFEVVDITDRRRGQPTDE